MKLGEKIQKLRKEKGYSQEELAAVLGVSRQAVSKWENDISAPDTDNLITLAELLGVELSELVSEERCASEEAVQEPVRRLPWLKLLTVVFLCLSVLLFCLWQKERVKEEKLELLCHVSAVSCLDSLQAYEKSGKQSDYLSAAAEFRAFMQAYHLLTEDSGRHGNCTFLNEAYGYMLCGQEKIDDNLSLLIKAMERLSVDFFDMTGHNLMYDLYVELRHG